MKGFFLSLLILATSAQAVINPGPDGVRFNKLEIARAEKTLLNQRANKDLSLVEAQEIDGLQTILKSGKRAVAWFELVNAKRSPESKLDLSTKGSIKGVPITNPNKTNSTILINRYTQILSELPPAITSVVTGTDDLPLTPPLSDEEFVKSIRRLDVLYQHTIRWIGAKNALSWYINRSLWDVRGHYFLKQIPNLQEKLGQFSSLSQEEQTSLTTWLFGLCHNGDFEDSDCQDELRKAVSKNTLWDYYNRFQKYGLAQYSSFFRLAQTRPEMTWNEDKTILHSPFLSTRADVQKWLVENVEEEWRGHAFQLKLDFYDSSKRPLPHLEFQSGVTAHVNEVGGDTITMDADHSLANYDQRWTIRHEYGHVLGFVDCYLEFYDVKEKAMIYYELDTDNLMCSRHGTLQEEHIRALKKAYQ